MIFRFTTLTLAACALLVANTALATPGGLDGKGCHNSRKAGYHCHRAQPSKPAAKKAAVAPKPAASSAKSRAPTSKP